MLTKDNARLCTRLTKTPVVAGNLLTKVGTTSVYRLDSWELHLSDFGAITDATLYVVPEKGKNKQAARLEDFGLEIYEQLPTPPKRVKRPRDKRLTTARNFKRAGGSKEEYMKLAEESIRAAAKHDNWLPSELAVSIADINVIAGKVWK